MRLIGTLLAAISHLSKKESLKVIQIGGATQLNEPTPVSPVPILQKGQEGVDGCRHSTQRKPVVPVHLLQLPNRDHESVLRAKRSDRRILEAGKRRETIQTKG